MRVRHLALPTIACTLVTAFCAVVWHGFSLEESRRVDVSPWVESAKTLGAGNVVSSIILGVRLMDTLVEVLVFAVAVLGVRYFLELPHGRARAEEIPESHLVAVSSAILLPLILVIGGYVTIYGHLSPGGGFSGGAIVATGLLLVAAGVGVERISARFRETALERAEWGTLVGLLGLLLLPIPFGRLPLTDLLPRGTPGALLSGGTVLPYNLLIGTKVVLGSWVIIHHFLRHRGEI
jgi:multicomponent Na+:H+ antiporter subunit B